MQEHPRVRLAALRERRKASAPRLGFLENEPVFDFVHAEPRYQAIVRKMNLPANR